VTRERVGPRRFGFTGQRAEHLVQRQPDHGTDLRRRCAGGTQLIQRVRRARDDRGGRIRQRQIEIEDDGPNRHETTPQKIGSRVTGEPV